MPELAETRPVVILAGGLGTRIEDFAPALPKALVPVMGEPFAFHQMRLLASQGVREVVYIIGHRGSQIQAAVAGGDAFGLHVSYVDEGASLHGTGGALRLALDNGALPEVFGLLYGDSYLPTDLAPIWNAFATSGCPALMTVYRNDDRWDRSNVVVEDDFVTMYDKRPEASDPRMAWIDYGFSILMREVVGRVPAGSIVDIGEVYRESSARRELAAHEVSERFYEAGSPQGVADLARFLSAGRAQ